LGCRRGRTRCSNWRPEKPSARATLEENSDPDNEYKVGDLVDFNAPKGGRFAGVLREIRDDVAIFDFNHPLAGQPVKFEVNLISVL
jgi:FKBP-type peptidyl-prolyl cis-trans isomerase SlpA